jgi:hypothetical protein
MLDRLEPKLRKKCLSALCKICGRQALLPRSLEIPACYDRSGEAPLYSGGYADVWKGEHQGLKVAVKVLKVYMTSDFDKITSVGHHLKLSNDENRGADCDCVEVLSGSRDMEKFKPPKRAPTVGSDNERQTLRDGI